MSTPSTRLLIADDQRDVLEALRLLLKAEGYQIDAVESPAAVLKALEQRDYDVVIIDLNYARDTTSGQEGLELLTKIHSADEMLPVVVMTAWGSVNVAVEAMRRGARDFVEKPWDNERLKAIVRTQAELGRALRRATRLEAQSRTTPERRRAVVDRGLGGDAAGACRSSRASDRQMPTCSSPARTARAKASSHRLCMPCPHAPTVRW
jgi:DNA-binding NtrC family response regulator